jgi:hypothetical protein
METLVTAVRAPEKQSLGAVISRLPQAKKYAAMLSARIEGITRQNIGRRFLEVGAAGYLTVAFNEMGYICAGLEPDEDAIRNAQERPLITRHALPRWRAIMWWAARHRPELVGHTATPAVHWFSDRIARKRLAAVGFNIAGTFAGITRADGCMWPL